MRTIMIPASMLLLAACGGTPTPAETPKDEAPKEEPTAEPKDEAKPAGDPTDAASFDALDADAKHAFLMKKGEEVYTSSTLACQTCHGADGKGTPPAFPPLVGQKDMMGDCVNHAAIVIYGLQGEIVVDGQTYNGVMTPQGDMLDDLQIAAVATYERNTWGNAFGDCTPVDVAKARAENPLK